MTCLTPKPSQIFSMYRIQCKEKCFGEKSFLRKRGSGLLNKNQKRKKNFWAALASVIQKDPTKSVRMQANEVKVHEKTMRIAIKYHLWPELNPLDYAIWGILENKTNATSHPNICSLKTAIEEKWNEMSE